MFRINFFDFCFTTENDRTDSPNENTRNGEKEGDKEEKNLAKNYNL